MLVSACRPPTPTLDHSAKRFVGLLTQNVLPSLEVLTNPPVCKGQGSRIVVHAIHFHVAHMSHPPHEIGSLSVKTHRVNEHVGLRPVLRLDYIIYIYIYNKALAGEINTDRQNSQPFR